MIRRIAALLGIAILLVTLVLLIWTVHLHRQRTMSGGSDVPSHVGLWQSSKGELL
ncbi:MAG TPA: hypothetical protein VIL97_09250 [Thermoanaerobaculia bacterium]